MERKIGKIFTFNGKKFEVVEGDCEQCEFAGEQCAGVEYDDVGECSENKRHDKTNVCFQLIENTERQIGEEFELKLRVKVVKSGRACKGCAFSGSDSCIQIDQLGACDYLTRSDGQNVHFEIVSCNNI